MMTSDNKIRNEKRQHNINREAAKLLAKLIYIYIYEYTRIAKTSPTDRSSMIEQADFTYSKGNLIKEKSKQIPP